MLIDLKFLHKIRRKVNFFFGTSPPARQIFPTLLGVKIEILVGGSGWGVDYEGGQLDIMGGLLMSILNRLWCLSWLLLILLFNNNLRLFRLMIWLCYLNWILKVFIWFLTISFLWCFWTVLSLFLSFIDWFLFKKRHFTCYIYWIANFLTCYDLYKSWFISLRFFLKR